MTKSILLPTGITHRPGFPVLCAALLLLTVSGCEEQFADTAHVAPASPRVNRQSYPATPQQQEPGSQNTSASDSDEEPPERIVRPEDPRPRHDPEQAAQRGIHRYASKHLELFTDIDPAIAESLPGLIDQAYEAWEEYFGKLPPAADGSDWQATGYLMAEPDRFIAAKMLPEEFSTFEAGQHRGREFWMRNPDTDYYRRHLLIHEATHCFMTVMPREWPPLWYLEGMAELFATHRIQHDGQVHFGVFPESPEEFPGLGRIETLQREIQQGRGLGMIEVSQLDQTDFAGSRLLPYAWTWALCQFLEHTPRIRNRFHRLSTTPGEDDFQQRFQNRLIGNDARLVHDWTTFLQQVGYGYDFERNAISQAGGDERGTGKWFVLADRGWQLTGVWVEPGLTVEIQAEGEAILAHEPRPWLSLPDGISIHYASGEPIGRLQSGILQLAGHDAGHDSVDDVELEETLQDLPLKQLGSGASQRFKTEQGGFLCLKINDFANRLAENRGLYEVYIRLSE